MAKEIIYHDIKALMDEGVNYGLDPHIYVYSKLHNIPYKEVTVGQRLQQKMYNFGYLYSAEYQNHIKQQSKIMDRSNFGAVATDQVTGFKGTIIGQAAYITGCDQFLIQPQVKDGAHVEGRWIDEGRLVIDENSIDGIDPAKVQGERPGADIAAPIK